jgi:hypothetical protein
VTAIPKENYVSFWHRPWFWAVVVAIAFFALNIIFW